MTKLKSFFFAGLALTLVIMTACSNAAQMPDAGTGGSAALPEAPFVEGGASLILSPDKLDITVKVTTADNSSVRIEGCTETELTSGTQTVLHAKGTRVILKGNIIKLYCRDNQLAADAFKKLFDDLPQRADSDNAKCVLYIEQTGVTEGNHTDFTAPSDLADAFNNAKNNKKWKRWDNS